LVCLRADQILFQHISPTNLRELSSRLKSSLLTIQGSTFSLAKE
jgi:hypothetical protein